MLHTNMKTRSVVALVSALACMFAQAATLELISSAPSNNATDISRGDSITLQFSAPVNASSVNSDSVSLRSSVGMEPATLNVSGSVISLQPLAVMLPWTIYTLKITSIVGIDAEQLAAPIDIVFTTRDGSWQAPQVSDRLSAEQFNPVTAVNSMGVRFVAWQQQNAAQTGDDIWVIRHSAADIVAPVATRIASYAEDHIEQLNVFVDESGNAFVTWVVAKPPFTEPRHIFADRFVAGTATGSGWTSPQVIDGNGERSGSNLHLTFDGSGDAFALWQEYDCCAIHSLQNIVANRFTAGVGWGQPVYLDTSGAFFAGKIDIQADDAGNAYAVWADFPNNFGSTDTIWVSRYQSGGGWSMRHALATETSVNGLGGHQVLAVNHRGDAFVMWTDDNGLKYSYTGEPGHWSSPVLIDTSVKTSASQLVLMDDGEAFAAFTVGVRQYNPQKRTWTWAHPLLTDQNASTDPRIVVDSTGNALVAWTQNVSGINRIYAKRYRAHRGWFHSQFIDTNPSSNSELQGLFNGYDGSATAAWLQFNADGSVDVQTAGFE